MEKFISIPNSISELKGANRFNLVALFATLKSHICTRDFLVKRYTKALADELDISVEAVKKLIPCLKQTGLLIDITKSEEDANGVILEHKCNVYHFKNDMHGDYMMVAPKLLKAKISSKLKGFILILRSFCKNGSNVVRFKNKSELRELLKIGDIRTLNNFLEELKGCDIATINEDSIVFNREYFYLYNPNSNLTDEQKLYCYLWDYCYINGVVPPMKHLNGRTCDKTLAFMAMELKGTTVNIKERIPNLPEEVTLEYFYKALCNEKREIHKKFEYEFTL